MSRKELLSELSPNNRKTITPELSPGDEFMEAFSEFLDGEITDKECFAIYQRCWDRRARAAIEKLRDYLAAHPEIQKELEVR